MTAYGPKRTYMRCAHRELNPTGALKAKGAWLPFVLLFLLAVHVTYAADNYQSKLPFIASPGVELADPWRAHCAPAYGLCFFSERATKKQLLSIFPENPEPYVLKIVVRRPFTGEPWEVGNVILKYASVPLSVFKTDSGPPNSQLSGHSTDWQFYFRIPDRGPSREFSISLENFIAKPHTGRTDIPLPSLTYRYSVNTAPPIGALADAARNGNVVEVKRLIQSGSSIYEVKTFGPDSYVDRTPMYFAAKLGKIEVVKALLDAGYDVNWQPEEVKSSLLIETIRSKASLDTILTLLNAGAKTDPLYWESGISYTALDFATSHPNFATLIPALVTQGADINRAGNWGSPLWQAMRSDRSEVQRVLKENGGVMLPPTLKCPQGSELKVSNLPEQFEQSCERKTSNGVVKHGQYILHGPDTKTRLFAEYENGALVQKQTFKSDGNPALTEHYFPNGSVRSRISYRDNGRALRTDIYDDKGEPQRTLLFDERGNRRDVIWKDGKEVPDAK